QAEGSLAQGDGDLAAGATEHPTDEVLPQCRDEPDLLEGLADAGQPLHQRQLVALHLPADREHDRARLTGRGAAGADVRASRWTGRRIEARVGRAVKKGYLVRRVLLLAVVVWIAATINF